MKDLGVLPTENVRVRMGIVEVYGTEALRFSDACLLSSVLLLKELIKTGWFVVILTPAINSM